MTGGDVLLKCLRAQGVRAIFGMPGTQNIALYDALHRSGEGLAHYLIRNEQGATMLANGFARASGEVAAAFTVPGPGASNASTGIVDAFTDCIPVLLVVGGYERAFATRDRAKMFHGLDQASFFRPITRYFGCPESADDIPRVVEEAFRAMFAGRPGPVVIELAPDVAAEQARSFDKPPGAVPRLTDEPFDSSEIAHASERLREMRRPVCLVGGDCIAADVSREVSELAELLQAPVIYGRLGKGVISDEHACAAGFTRTRRTMNLLQQCDGVVAIGFRFTQIDTLNWTLELPRNLVQIDRDRRELGREYPISAGVGGGLSSSLRALLADLQNQTWSQDPAWKDVRENLQRDWRNLPPIPIQSQIRKALPRDGLISVDVTATGYSCFDHFPVYGPRSLIYPCHSVTLGFGLPAAIGAKLAQPDRAVVALCGDGGFMMNCNELATAVEHQVGVVAIVVKDNCLTAIKGSQEQAFAGRSIDTHMQTPDFVALAQSFGAHGVSTSKLDDLPWLIHDGLSRTGPTVIEVHMEDQVDNLIRHIPWLHGE